MAGSGGDYREDDEQGGVEAGLGRIVKDILECAHVRERQLAVDVVEGDARGGELDAPKFPVEAGVEHVTDRGERIGLPRRPIGFWSLQNLRRRG